VFLNRRDNLTSIELPGRIADPASRIPVIVFDANLGV
jgi:hypothetical protein